MEFRECLRLAPVAAALFLAACAEDAVPQSSNAPSGNAPSAEEITLGSDGWTLHGTFRSGGTGAQGPAALLLHRAAGARGEYGALAEALAARGVASLALDLRGHGESVNLGRFEEPYSEHLHINEGADRDVAAALSWLAARGGVDPGRLAVVGASYSGEMAALALRGGAGPVRAAVMLSPGSFSQDSIEAIDASVAKWLFVRSVEEGSNSKQWIDAIFDELAQTAPSAERRVLDGAGHATELFDSRPELADDLADWIEAAVRPGAED